MTVAPLVSLYCKAELLLDVMLNNNHPLFLKTAEGSGLFAKKSVISFNQTKIFLERQLHFQNYVFQYAISQLRIVRSGLHLVTYKDVGNF